MIRSGQVFFKDRLAGKVWQDEIENQFGFQYEKSYLNSENAQPVSFTLPMREESYLSDNMIPFFDGLIPEGWLLKIVVKNWKLDPRDRMGLLLTACRDCIGAVYIISNEK
jgi:serine/threonine-protein kinase HipA